MRRALLLSGLLHGIWHLPVMLLTSLFHPVGSRLVVVPMFLVAATALGVFNGWLRLRTDSVWPAVLAHSAHNVAVAWMSGLMVGNAVVIQYVAGEGAVTTAAYVTIAAWLLMRARHLQPNAAINTATTIDKPQPVPAAGRCARAHPCQCPDRARRRARRWPPRAGGGPMTCSMKHP